MQYQSRRGTGPVLVISQDEEKGLCFKWNFIRANSLILQYYHIFLFLGKHEREARQFFQSYYDNLKLGQIIGIFVNQNYYYWPKNTMVWYERSGLNSSVAKIKKSFLVQHFTDQLLTQVTQLIIQKRGMIVLNIFCDSSCSNIQKITKIKIQIQKTIKCIRFKNQKANKIIYNMISPYFRLTNINNYLGFNQIHYDIEASKFYCKDLLVYIRTITVRSLTLTIQIKEKYNVLSNRSNQWQFTDGKQIYKKYYALPKIQFNQHIKFLQIKDQKQNISFQLDILLHFQYFDDSQIRDRKSVFVQTKKICFKDIYGNKEFQKSRPYQFGQGVFMRTHLFNRASHILLYKAKLQQEKSKKKINGKNI